MHSNKSSLTKPSHWVSHPVSDQAHSLIYIIMYIRLKGLNQRYLFPHGSRGWEAKMPGLVSDKTFFESCRQPPSSHDALRKPPDAQGQRGLLTLPLIETPGQTL